MPHESHLEGRIAAIADTFDALTTKGVYKPPFHKALTTLHDPAIVATSHAG
jgi:response regulator RpfG family c-di-GMP phosphodiesterase